jgi:tRNA pseudouridine55 synthase
MEFHGFLNIDKPLGWTSHDVVGKLRRILKTKKIGHAGTLDPAATGVLVVGVGRATKFLDNAQSGEKSYIGHVVLGTTSESADIDGRLESSSITQTSALCRQDVSSVAQRFVGTIEQIPPKFSAVKKDGEPLYRKARRGEDVDVPSRTVRVDSIEVLRYDHPDLIIKVDCGTGVYIRSLARDIGEELGQGGYLHHLVRIRVGRFEIQNALRVSRLERLMFPESWAAVSHSIDSVLSESPAIFAGKEQEHAWYHGRSITVRGQAPTIHEQVRTYSQSGIFAGVGSAEPTTGDHVVIRPRMVIAPSEAGRQ